MYMYMYDCLGCAVLLYLVVCLTLLASFFLLISHEHMYIYKHVHVHVSKSIRPHQWRNLQIKVHKTRAHVESI